MWAGKFMSALEEVFKRENLLLAFNLNSRIGIASNGPKLLFEGNKKNFFKGDLVIISDNV